MDALKSFILNYTELPDVDWEKISQCFELKTLNKDELLLEEGKICRHLYFIEHGLLRFYIHKDGNEITKFFTDAPYCFTSQLSFTNGKPAAENIAAIEDCVLRQITLSKANELLELKSWNTFIRKLIQEVQFFTEEILKEIQTETAENRYRKLLTQNPQLLQRIPLQYLASFLGIAPQSLSRIRKKIVSDGRS